MVPRRSHPGDRTRAKQRLRIHSSHGKGGRQRPPFFPTRSPGRGARPNEGAAATRRRRPRVLTLQVALVEPLGTSPEGRGGMQAFAMATRPARGVRGERWVLGGVHALSEKEREPTWPRRQGWGRRACRAGARRWRTGYGAGGTTRTAGLGAGACSARGCLLRAVGAVCRQDNRSRDPRDAAGLSGGPRGSAAPSAAVCARGCFRTGRDS